MAYGNADISKKPRTYRKVINGIALSSYNDSNCDWVISCKYHKGVYRQEKLTMKDAMKLHADISESISKLQD